MAEVDVNAITEACNELAHWHSEVDRLSGGPEIMARANLSRAVLAFDRLLGMISVDTLIEFLTSREARNLLDVPAVRTVFFRGLEVAPMFSIIENRWTLFTLLDKKLKKEEGEVVLADEFALTILGTLRNWAGLGQEESNYSVVHKPWGDWTKDYSPHERAQTG